MANAADSDVLGALVTVVAESSFKTRYSLALIVTGIVLAVSVLARTQARSAHAVRAASAPTIVLCGPSGGGKTRVFARAVFGRDVETSASTAAASGWTTTPRALVHDTPGDTRLRASTLARVLPNATGAVCVLDTGQHVSARGIRDAGDTLAAVFAALQIVYARTEHAIPLLILIVGGPTERAELALTRELARRAAANPPGATLSGLSAIPSQKTARPWYAFWAASGRRAAERASILSGTVLPADEIEWRATAAELGPAPNVAGDHVWRGGVTWASIDLSTPPKAGTDALAPLWVWATKKRT